MQVTDLSRTGVNVTEEALQLINAHDTPRLDYDPMRRSFSLQGSSSGAALIGEAMDKVSMFANRYSLIHQRILRQDVFQKGRGSHELTCVESLLGRSGRRFLLRMIFRSVCGLYAYIFCCYHNVNLNNYHLCWCRWRKGILSGRSHGSSPNGFFSGFLADGWIRRGE